MVRELRITSHQIFIYQLLVDGRGRDAGLTKSEVADREGVTRSAIQKPARFLEDRGYIERIPHSKNPVFYMRGSNANLLDEYIKSMGVNPDGEAIAVNPKGRKVRGKNIRDKVTTARTHLNGSVKISVRKTGDMHELLLPSSSGKRVKTPTFELEPYNVRNGVMMWKGHLNHNGMPISIHYIESHKGTRTLLVYPPEKELTPGQFEDAEKHMLSQAREVTNLFSRYGGWDFGDVELKGEVEFATTDERLLANIPESDGRKGPSSELWVDRSHGERELETNNPRTAANVFDFTYTIKRFDEYQRRTDSRLDGLEVEFDRLLSLNEKLCEHVMGAGPDNKIINCYGSQPNQPDECDGVMYR